MATQTGNIKITGTIDNLCFYKMNGQFYVRTKSSLTAKRVKQSPAFQLTRVYAGLMGQASKIASIIYKALPKDFRQFWMYRAFTGEAMQLLKAAYTIEETTQLLWQTYVAVWEQKKAVNQTRQSAKRLPSQNKIAADKLIPDGGKPLSKWRGVWGEVETAQKAFIISPFIVTLYRSKKRIKRKVRTRWQDNQRSMAGGRKHPPWRKVAPHGWCFPSS